MTQQDLFGTIEQGEKILTRRHAISDAALAHFRQPYGEDGEQIQFSISSMGFCTVKTIAKNTPII